MFKFLKHISPSCYTSLMVLATLYCTIAFNSLFIIKVFNVSTIQEWSDWLFLASVPILLFFLTLLLFSWFSLITFVRPFLFITIVLSSVLLYASINYGVIFDKSMMQNIIETDTGEAFSYLNINLVLFVLTLGLIPAYLMTKNKIRQPLKQRLKSFILINFVSITFISLIAFSFYQNYASVGRNNKEVASYITPFSFYIAGYKYLRDNYFYPPLPFRLLDKTPALASKSGANITVVVVGETARASNFSHGGYKIDTNEYTKQDGIKYFSKMSSCGTATAISVPCMFSRLDRAHYNSRLAQSQDNVLDVIHRAGADVFWIDNNSSCKGVCNRVENYRIDTNKDNPLCDGKYCFDEVLIPSLMNTINNAQTSNIVVVLHMIGSHGPTYYRRYPKTQQKFLPDCQRSDIQNCTPQELVNTYDNTIAYTDLVLHKIITQLSSLDAETVNMLYVSDHGESLGETGLYLHGFPYRLAPKEQTQIPMIYWSNRLTNKSYSDCIDAVKQQPLSHDNIYDTLLGLTQVNSKTYQSKNDIFATCRTQLFATNGETNAF
ncbi:phosphoethanolamine transferase [Pseudoalteromonas maricaloris]|uniref:phosphoethanolamine transferase n=1 Tax=Pseudoalteromonas maricaloris TaxID=184924 RepID=UPI0021AE1E9F|nr:phosphoethanolamine--lipid A transferase [Pseudoalteromonas flavipulchra]USE69540.1 phosphoethanolamine transferase [Pseudoalteromonas flavipulchra]